MSNTLTSKVSGRMSSRGWAIALGIGAVVLAAILLVVYLDRYRGSRRRRECPDAGARRQAAHPGGNAWLARCEPGDVRDRRRSRRRTSRSERSPTRHT